MKQFNTREELLQDAINYYWGNAERLCVDGEGKCQYIPSKTSEGCAIGRLLPLDITESLVNTAVTDNRVFNALPTWLQDMGVEFLSKLQECHDFKAFRDKDGDEVYNRMCGHVDMDKIVFPN